MMIALLRQFTARVGTAVIVWAGFWIHATALAQEAPSGTAASQTELAAMTSEWKGERCSDGRPRVADDLLRRMKAISIEEAWEVLAPAWL